jgi:hypothetical protein
MSVAPQSRRQPREYRLMKCVPPAICQGLVIGVCVRDEVDIGRLAPADALETHRLRVAVEIYGGLAWHCKYVRISVV